MSAPRFEDFFTHAICERRPFYNFGAGEWRHRFFNNIDIIHPRYPKNNPDIVFDAFVDRRLPLATGSAKIFYFSHVNEHLNNETNDNILAEAYRCLEPGGVLRIVFPDFDAAVRAYERQDFHFFYQLEPRHLVGDVMTLSILELFFKFFATRSITPSPKDGNRKYSIQEFRDILGEHGYEEAANYVTSTLNVEAQQKAPACHINWWNQSKIATFLRRAGFNIIAPSAYLQCLCPPMREARYFDVTHPEISGYVDAVK
jgi:SAM-dependent methyltransferase